MTSNPLVRDDSFAIAQQQLDLVAERLGLDDSMRQLLRTPHRELTVVFPVIMDDGRTQMFTGYRVQHNLARGPAKGGVCCDTKTMSRYEIERLTRRYTTEIAFLIGPTSDIPAPDMYTDAQVMAWIMDTYSMHKGYSVPGVVTGKPLSIGGSLGRPEATGRGCVFTILQAARRLGIDIHGATAAVQGFGNAGSAAARFLEAAGCRVIAVSDSKGGVYHAQGLNTEAVLGCKRESGSVGNFPEGERLSNEELLALPCDILVPAALENQITASNAPRVQAKLVAEAANDPTTPETDAILESRGIWVIPDILANAGGVTVSYFEWVQNLQEFRWKEEQVNQQLREVMEDSFEQVLAIAEREPCSLRLAAYMLGVDRVVQATHDRGIYP